MPRTPNILLIQVDQMHASCLSLLGHPVVRTPNLDRLAREGVLYRNATANNPICMPSRVSMLSGQYTSTLRQYGFSGLCDARTPWLQGELKRAGYRTGAFGKLHVLCIGQEQWDFDACAPTMPEDLDLARPAGNHYKAYCEKHGVPWPTDQIHGHNPFGENSGNPASAKPEMNWARKRSCRSEVPLAHSLETWTTDRCLDFLRDAAADDRPFFAWLTYDRPHSPTTLPEPWFSRIRPDAVPLQPLPTAEQMTRLPPSWFHDFTRNASVALMGEADFKFTLATYFTCIEWLDAEIGRVMAALESSGAIDNTTIVFTADHGDEAGWHGLYDKGRGLTSEAVTRVPLIIRPAPALFKADRNRIVQEPVELVDLMPTLCAQAGIPAPDRVEGRDLSASLLSGRPLDPHRPVFCEDYWNRMVTRDGWKLVFDMCHEAENVLFDMTADPQTFDNRYNDPACLDRRLELKRVLLGFVLERLYGPWRPADAERIERGLDDADPTLSPIIQASPDGLQFYRAAAVLNDDTHILLVPFYEAPLRLFERANRKRLYLTNRDAAPFDPVKADALVDRALRTCFPRLSSVALFVHEKAHSWRCDHPRPTLEESRNALAEKP
jgi:arylsulfatase A-like enzyme